MGKLIEADALIETLQNEPNYSIELPSYMGDAIRKLVNTHHAMVIDVIKKQPTAYDVDAVVEELGDWHNHYDDGLIVVDEAIQIVKDGGSNGSNKRLEKVVRNEGICKRAD